jgi:hypothetical protein
MSNKKQVAPETSVGPKLPVKSTEGAPTPSPMGPWGPGGIKAPGRPNLYQLHGDHVHVTYSPSGFDGQAYFIYHDSHETKEFYGEEVRITAGEWGTLVSVTLALGLRSTNFTLLVPKVALIGGTQAAVKTFGFTTLEEIGAGQTQLYTIVNLSGTAWIVQF